MFQKAKFNKIKEEARREQISVYRNFQTNKSNLTNSSVDLKSADNVQRGSLSLKKPVLQAKRGRTLDQRNQIRDSYQVCNQDFPSSANDFEDFQPNRDSNTLHKDLYASNVHNRSNVINLSSYIQKHDRKLSQPHFLSKLGNHLNNFLPNSSSSKYEVNEALNLYKNQPISRVIQEPQFEDNRYRQS